MSNASVDALIVVPPFTSNETNPPLGPAILLATLADRGIAAEVRDLGIAFLNAAGPLAAGFRATRCGDQDKDRNRIARVRAR